MPSVKNCRLLATVSVLLLIAMSGCVEVGSADYVCLSCETGIEETAADDVDLWVERSDLEIRVHENGSARWRVRADLSGENLSKLAAERERPERLARRAVADSIFLGITSANSLHGGDVRNVTAAFENGTLQITFVVPDMGRRSISGVVLVDQFHVNGEKPAKYSLGTDRVVVRGPPGTVVANDPRSGSTTADHSAIVWEGSGSKVSGETYIVFGPDQEIGTRLAAYAAIATDVAHWLAPRFQSGAIGGFTMLLVAFALLGLATSRDQEDTQTASESVLGPKPPYQVVGIVLVVLGSIAAIGLAVSDAGGSGRDIVRVLFVFPPIVPVVLFLVLGADLVRGGRWRRLLLLAIFLAPLIMVTPTAATPSPSGPSSVGSPLTFWIGFAIAVVLGPLSFEFIRSVYRPPRPPETPPTDRI